MPDPDPVVPTTPESDTPEMSGAQQRQKAFLDERLQRMRPRTPSDDSDDDPPADAGAAPIPPALTRQALLQEFRNRQRLTPPDPV